MLNLTTGYLINPKKNTNSRPFSKVIPRSLKQSTQKESSALTKTPPILQKFLNYALIKWAKGSFPDLSLPLPKKAILPTNLRILYWMRNNQKIEATDNKNTCH